MSLEELRVDCALKQRKGLHFILSSILIWLIVTMIHLTRLPILTKNLMTFCATTPLVPMAYALSKLLRIEFADKTNPLNQLGLLFSLNQMLYLLIAMWIYPTVPSKLIMVIAMIFGAHLLPYSWLYKSKAYMFMSVGITCSALILGLKFDGYVLAGYMVVCEIIFSIALIIEVRNMRKLLIDRELPCGNSRIVS